MSLQLRQTAVGLPRRVGLADVEGVDSANQALNGNSQQPPVQTVAIVGGKGGIGRSNVAVNLAAALSSADREVLMLDADLELGNVDQLLGLHIHSTLSWKWRE